MFERFQNIVLEMIARGSPLDATAERICREAERMAVGVTCSILAVDPEGRLHPLAAPSLPDHFSAALDGLPIGPKVGSCGTAAFRREAVTVTDIARDPLWADYVGLASPLGLAACWSSPIMDGAGRVLGTFAFYYRCNRGPDGIERQIVAACVDLCAIALERDLARAENHRLAYFDALTTLPNRANFNAAIDRAERGGPGFSLLLIDIDRLKQINDTFGHLAGDDLIREIAQRIGAHAVPGTAYRIGGDEFAVIVADDEDGADTRAIVERLIGAMGKAALCGRHAIAPSVTIGGTISRREADANAATLRLQADLALYHAKETRRGGFVLYTGDLGTTIARRSRVVREVSEALAEDRIEAHYQPIVRLDTLEVVGVEALCRVRAPDGSLVAAGDFMEAMQDISIGTQITDCMMTHVAADIRVWLDAGIPFQHVGLNVTNADFQRADLQERVTSAFARHNVPLRHLILEVTESVYMGETDQTVGQAVTALRAQGLLVALDDFGTGYASLTHLLCFPVDVIKIDKTFVDTIGPDGAKAVIVKGLIEIAGKLGMRIVAEGVESADQAAQLVKLGCKLGQGYLFGHPADRVATTDLLRRRAQHPQAASIFDAA